MSLQIPVKSAFLGGEVLYWNQLKRVSGRCANSPRRATKGLASVSPHSIPTPTEETTEDGPNPSGLCMCGCGESVPLATRTRPEKGLVKGKSIRYVAGHAARRAPDGENPNPSGLCRCGCGRKTTIAVDTIPKYGAIRGYPRLYIQGHASVTPRESVRIEGDIALIPLANGEVAIVDADMAPVVSPWRWSADLSPDGVICGASSTLGKLHHVVMGSTALHDHADGNPLNNRRRNLRRCTQLQNCGNTRKSQGRTSQYKGVNLQAGNGKWRAGIRIHGKLVYLGQYEDQASAARAYDAAARNHFGEFACLNFPESGERSALTGEIEGERAP